MGGGLDYGNVAHNFILLKSFMNCPIDVHFKTPFVEIMLVNTMHLVSVRISTNLQSRVKLGSMETLRVGGQAMPTEN